MGLNPILQISADYNTPKMTIPLKTGTFKETKNHNKILDSAEFSTTFFEAGTDTGTWESRTVNFWNEETPLCSVGGYGCPTPSGDASNGYRCICPTGNPDTRTEWTYRSGAFNRGVVLENYREGYYVWVDGEMKYIISTIKKTRNGNTNQWRVEAVLVSLTYILQKITLPNKSLRQRLAGTPKYVLGEIQKLMEVYFNRFRGYNNFSVSYPDALEVAEEFTWTEPTLYEVLCDLAQNGNRVPYLTFNGTNFVLNFMNVSTLGSAYAYPQYINGLEQNGDVEFMPQKMINTIVNNLSNGTIKERGLYPKSETGVFADDNESNFYQTSLNINKIEKVYVEGWLPASPINNLLAGQYLFDITQLVVPKEVFDSMLVNPSLEPNTINAFNYRNGRLYFEKDKPNVYGAFLNYKNFFGSIVNTNLTYILNGIIKYARPQIIQAPTTDASLTKIPANFTKHLSLLIEYKTMDSIRIDLNKGVGTSENPLGFGEIVQNQGNAYVNFLAYYKQQKDILGRLGSQEEVVMGRVYNKAHLPLNGQTYGGKLIVQTITIPNVHYIDFMFICTDAFNRIDGDAIINTKKRFTSILSPSESIERHEYAEISLNSVTFDAIKDQFNYDWSTAKYFIRLRSILADETMTDVILNYLIQEIDNDTMLVSVKTENNYFAGTKLVESGSTILMEGVPYTDINGEAEQIIINFVQVGLSMDDYKELPDASVGSITNIAFIGTMFSYKDNGEKIALSILVKRS